MLCNDGSSPIQRAAIRPQREHVQADHHLLRSAQDLEHRVIAVGHHAIGVPVQQADRRIVEHQAIPLVRRQPRVLPP